MKCPKCGYHSFDHLESCKKCGGGLAAHRSRFGLGSYFLSGPGGAAAGGEAAEAAGGPLPDAPGQGGSAVVGELVALERQGADGPVRAGAEAGGGAAVVAGSACAPGTGVEVLALDEEDLLAFAPAVEPGALSAAAAGTPFETGGGSGLLAGGGVAEAGAGVEDLFDECPGLPPSGEEAAAVALLHRHALPADGLAQPTAATGLEPAAASGEREGALPPISRRLAASGIDLLLLSLLCIAFLLAGGLALSPDGAGGALLNLAALLELSTPFFLVFFFVTFGYFTLFHYLIGQTPGKMLLRLRVEGMDGAPLLFSQAFLRSVGGLLSLLVAGAGFWLIPLHREQRGWNDRLAGSRVVPADLPEGDAGFPGEGAEMEGAEPF